MSKVQDYELRGLPQQAIDMFDDIREVLNNGKVQSSVATTGIPGWSANTGEFAFFSSGSDRRVYLRSSTAWLLVGGFDPTLLPSSLGTVSAGTGNVFAIIDHIHALQTTSGAVSFGTPVAIDTANNAGSGTNSARDNHIHLGFLQQGSMLAFVTTGASTWTRPTGVSRVYVKLWGAGGAGGGGDENNSPGGGGGGGGAGGYAEGFVTVTGNVTVTVGSAGTAVPGNTAGVNGSSSQFAGAVTVTANGGSGGGFGQDNPGGGGGGGTATNGDLNATGQAGQRGRVSDSLVGGHGGNGGSVFGGNQGGHGGESTVTGYTVGESGETGGVVGAGGGGGAGRRTAVSSGSGGVGGQGLVLVYW